VVDPYGRTVASLPLGVEGVLDSGLPRAGSITLYARAGDFVFAGLLLLFLALSRLRVRE
jgi:apolipoprotein N-acyltransferase